MDLTTTEANQVNNAWQTSGQDTFSKANRVRCEKYVLSIQRRLDKAVANGDKPRIRWYSHILMKRSRAVKVLAVYRVCKVNQGRYTAGVDGIAMPKDRSKAEIKMVELLREIDIEKKPSKIKRVYIPKPNGDKRPLGIPTISDRINQDIIRQTIEPVCEYHFSHQSYGFRPKRSCHDAVEDIFAKMSRKASRQWVIEGDIKGCFNHIRHSHINTTLKDWGIGETIRIIIDRMLKSGVMKDGVTMNSSEGTPQGGVISPLLANVALTCLDNEITKHDFHSKDMNPIVRYADDFVIVANNREQAEAIKGFVATLLKLKVGVELSDEKTKITHISNGFDFLGFNFRKYRDKLLIMPSKENISRVKRNLKATLKECRDSRAVVERLNPIIMGWSNYYRHCIAKHTFNQIGTSYLWVRVWEWTGKKHPTRTCKYRVARYYDDWTFTDKPSNKQIRRMNDTAIRRFVKVKKGKRVYDAKAKEYWEHREKVKSIGSIFTESKLVKKLFIEQNGKCLYCKEPVTQDEVQSSNIHIHHMIPRSEGGDWKLSNLRLLHADCHTELHQNLSRQDMIKFMSNKIDYLRLMKFNRPK
jgi:RNA-directed DNA polymerase